MSVKASLGIPIERFSAISAGDPLGISPGAFPGIPPKVLKFVISGISTRVSSRVPPKVSQGFSAGVPSFIYSRNFRAISSGASKFKVLSAFFLEDAFLHSSRNIFQSFSGFIHNLLSSFFRGFFRSSIWNLCRSYC